MPAAYVPLVIDQGEDYTAQVVWTDEYDEPQKLVAPARLDIVNAGGQLQLSLQTPDTDLPPGEIPAVGLSGELGLIQLHIPAAVTSALLPGEYNYDFFVSVDDGNAYAGDQKQRIMFGPATVSKSITKL